MGVIMSALYPISSKPPADLEDSFDLVIIGAGPTGLLSALLARQLDLKVLVLDAKEGPLKVGGADALTARTQQYLEVASSFPYEAFDPSKQSNDLLSRLLDTGIRCNTSTTYANGEFTSRQPTWWNSLPHTFYNTLLMIGQPFIERHLTSYLDIPVCYSEPALAVSYTFNEDSSEQLAIIHTANRTVKATYCLAADGAKSFVRNKLGIGWEGTKPNMVWAVLDCWIETTFPLSKEIVTLQIEGQSRMAWIPRERGMQRFYILLDDEVTQEKAEAEVRRHMAPHSVEFTHVEWFSKFEIKERIASTFLHPTPTGPYILAGDSAHVHSVNGGQGMNTGLSDAFNLIWRLAFLIKAPASFPTSTKSAVLGSYDTERRSTAKEVIDVAAKLVRSTTSEAKYYVELIEKNAGFITGMGVKYSGLGSACVREGERGVFKGGERCPDLWLQDRNGDGCRLYQKFRYGRYVVLAIGRAVGLALEEYDAKAVAVIRVQRLKALSVGVEVKRDESDVDGYSARRDTYGCSYVKSGESFMVLVRPDSYVECVGDAEDIQGYVKARYDHLLM